MRRVARKHFTELSCCAAHSKKESAHDHAN